MKSFLKKTLFIWFSIAVLIIFLGFWSVSKPESKDLQQAMMKNGKQVVQMKIIGYEYKPHQFIVQQGIPVEFRIDARKALGCGQVVVIPKLNLIKYVSLEKETIITFTPTETGFLDFNCGMNMMTPDSWFSVLPAQTIR